MQASSYVEAFTARGVVLWREGDSLRYRAPAGVLTPPVVAKLKRDKSKILPLLPTAPPSDSETYKNVQKRTTKSSSVTSETDDAETYRADLMALWELARRESWRLHERPDQPAELVMPTEDDLLAVGIWEETARALHEYGLGETCRVLFAHLKHDDDNERRGAAQDLSRLCLLLRPTLRNISHGMKTT